MSEVIKFKIICRRPFSLFCKEVGYSIPLISLGAGRQIARLFNGRKLDDLPKRRKVEIIAVAISNRTFFTFPLVVFLWIHLNDVELDQLLNVVISQLGLPDFVKALQIIKI